MSATRIATRYAKSLLGLAVEQDKLETVLEDMKAFKAAVDVRDFYLLLKSPIIHGSKKIQIVDAIFKGELDPITDGFIKTAIRKGREMFLPEMGAAFIEQYNKFKNINSVHITTATKWSDSEIAALTKKLKENKIISGELSVTTSVDSEILGGFILEFEDKLYDASSKHSIDKLRKELTH